MNTLSDKELNEIADEAYAWSAGATWKQQRHVARGYEAGVIAERLRQRASEGRYGLAGRLAIADDLDLFAQQYRQEPVPDTRLTGGEPKGEMASRPEASQTRRLPRPPNK